MTQKTKLPDYSPLFKPRWSGDVGGYTKEQLQAYGAACAAHAMQSQAERIKELEAEIITRASYGDEQTDFAIKLAGERDALRAQLAEIAASEPVAWADDRVVDGKIGAVHSTAAKRYWEKSDAVDRKNAEILRHPLFTRPMPAQDVTELMEALEKLARLGNGEHYGNSDGNMIARKALSKYKGAR